MSTQPPKQVNQNGRQGGECDSPHRPPRDVTINVRAKQSQRDLIDRAAFSKGKSRSEFMLETACREAESALLDRRFFSLDDQKFNQFLARLDAPPAENEKLRALLTKSSRDPEGTSGRTMTTVAPWD